MAQDRWNARFLLIQAVAQQIPGMRIAVCCTLNVNRVVPALEYRWLLLSPGERPPADTDWTIYEHRADMGWKGRSA